MVLGPAIGQQQFTEFIDHVEESFLLMPPRTPESTFWTGRLAGSQWQTQDRQGSSVTGMFRLRRSSNPVICGS